MIRSITIKLVKLKSTHKVKKGGRVERKWDLGNGQRWDLGIGQSWEGAKEGYREGEKKKVRK